MGWSSGIKSWQDFEKWFLWLESWERFGGLVFDSLISVVFCLKRVWNLVLVFGFWFCGALDGIHFTFERQS